MHHRRQACMGSRRLAIFKLGDQGFVLPYDTVLSVVSSQPDIHLNPSGIRLRGRVIYNDSEVVALKPEQVFGEPIAPANIQAYVVVKQDNYLAALPFDGFCKVVSPDTQNEQIDALRHFEFSDISVSDICSKAGIKPQLNDSLSSSVCKPAQTNFQPKSEEHYLIAKVGKYTLALECKAIDFLYMATPIYTSNLSQGFFQGMARFQNEILPLIKLTDYLGIPNCELIGQNPQAPYLTALIKTERGLIGLTLDSMLARISLNRDGIKSVTCLPPPLCSIFQTQLTWNGQEIPIIDMNPIAQDSMLRGLISIAKRLTKARIDEVDQKNPKRDCHSDRILSAIAFDRLCLKMEEVSTVLNLKDPRAVEIDRDREEVCIRGSNEWLPLHDLSELVFGQPLKLNSLAYGIVVQVGDHKRVFGVERLDQIATVQWAAKVPRVGARPARGVGKHIELVQVEDRGLQRRLSANELAQMVSNKTDDHFSTTHSLTAFS